MSTAAAEGFWSKQRIQVRGTMFNSEVDGWRHSSNAELAVTPAFDQRSGDVSTTSFVITHYGSGVALWPDALSLDRAMALCLELCRVPGWRHAMPTDSRFVDGITKIARKYFVASDAPSTLM